MDDLIDSLKALCNFEEFSLRGYANLFDDGSLVIKMIRAVSGLEKFRILRLIGVTSINEELAREIYDLISKQPRLFHFSVYKNSCEDWEEVKMKIINLWDSRA